ncbi:Stk1 family PASTA domain-containing Ser/Thr kinase [Arcanobacterium canis]|uniref:non-specific serine/threonine protein kinase n=1 Tax=Arcanobacterium canis TaxID=999183 RepID=A0ABY8G0M9_9ACTO|nr:Stk1 family PASTA domain-containing Ser/Thr kinase [Arcanobacterium canis]WFM82721.1 Stk1 family PASTA domain-containing Ser/Thr kinase [Arcanobacterium canis]
MNASDPLIGCAIDGRYFITARIARGGMATVYRARDSRLDREVALKIIHPHLAEDPAFVERFIRESRSAASLSSPQIVSVFDQGIARVADADRAYLVMELISGPNLRMELNSHGSLPLGTALEITRQVLAALSVAHAKNVVHRDVKPENILLDATIDTSAVVNAPRIHAKVADFGLARAASDPKGTHTGTLLGTIAYVPPELVSHGLATPASDIYSTGIMLYELIAGTLPYEGETAIQVAYAHVNTPMPRLSALATWIPAGVDSLIALFTAKDPAKRPASAYAALDALDDIVASIPQELRFRRIPVFPYAHDCAPTATTVIETESSSQPQKTESLPQLSGTYQHTQRIDEPTVAPTTTDELETSSPSAPRRRRWPVVLAVLALVLCASGIAWWYFAKGPGLRIEVPQVAGQSIESAHSTLSKAGFTYKDREDFSDTVPEGTVVDTDPSGGAKIHPSRVISIVISKGIEQVTVPDVVGKSSDEAQNILTEGRLSPTTSDEYSETVPKGHVISQKPAGGRSVNHDSDVTVVVSKGRAPIEITDYTGKSADTAKKELTGSGFTVDVTEEFSDSVDQGTVISQNPHSGTGYKNDSIKLVVSKGPELIEVPSVFGRQKETAIKKLEEAGFTVKVEADALWGEVFGTVRAQSPAAGQKAKKGSTVTINVV